MLVDDHQIVRAGLKQIFALTVSHPAHRAANFLVEIARESTVVADFILP